MPTPRQSLDVLPANRKKTRADERARTAGLLITSDRSCVAGVCWPCKSPISRRLSLSQFAVCCTALRSRWYQNGINTAPVSALRDYPSRVPFGPHWQRALRRPIDRWSIAPTSFLPLAAARYWWTNLTAVGPLPTAEANRLMDPLRTSPAAKIAGRLVTRRYRSRESRCQMLSSSAVTLRLALPGLLPQLGTRTSLPKKFLSTKSLWACLTSDSG